MRGGAGIGMFAYQAATSLSPRPKAGGGGAPIVPLRGDAVFGDGGEHPRTWQEFIGQETAKLYLLTAITSAKRRGTRLDHVLLATGRGGVGKTSLAKLIAAELGTDYVERGGKLTDQDLAEALSVVGDQGVLFIDEIHRLAETRSRGQVLLTYMQGGQLYLGKTKVPASEQVTIIGATTEAGKLAGPLLQRFRVKPVFVDYSDAEAAQIAAGLAGKLGFGAEGVPMPTDPGFFAEVAVAASHTPRTMAAVLAATRDIAVTTDGANFTDGRYDLGLAFAFLGMRPDGMTAQACEYLVTLAFAFEGVAGRESIADTMTEPGGLTDTEELLVERGLVRKTRRGRELTDEGLAYADQLHTDQEAA